MTTSMGTGRIHEGLDLKWCCDICGNPRNGHKHTACAKTRQAIYAMPSQQRLAVLALQKQGFRPQAITATGIGLSRGNDHRVVDEHGKQIRGVGAKR